MDSLSISVLKIIPHRIIQVFFTLMHSCLSRLNSLSFLCILFFFFRYVFEVGGGCLLINTLVDFLISLLIVVVANIEEIVVIVLWTLHRNFLVEEQRFAAAESVIIGNLDYNVNRSSGGLLVSFFLAIINKQSIKRLSSDAERVLVFNRISLRIWDILLHPYYFDVYLLLRGLHQIGSTSCLFNWSFSWGMNILCRFQCLGWSLLNIREDDVCWRTIFIDFDDVFVCQIINHALLLHA